MATGFNEATRILRVVESAVAQRTRSGANIEQTYGQVFGISGQTASVYLAGSRELAESDGGVPEPSDGYRIPSDLFIQPDDYVRVSIDARGHRWVEEVLPTEDYPSLSLDPVRGRLMLGDGTSPPTDGQEGQNPTVKDDGSLAYTFPTDMLFVPFVVNDPSGTVSNASMKPFDAANEHTAGKVFLPWDFQVVGITITSSEARTAGTLAATARINGANTNLTATLDGTNTASAMDRGLPTEPPNIGLAGQYVEIVYTTSGFTPTTAYVYGGIFVIVNRLSGTSTHGGSFTADAVIFASPNPTFTADAVLKATTAGTFTADAVLASAAPPPPPPSGMTGLIGTELSLARNIVPGMGAASLPFGGDRTFTADAILRKTASATFTADAVLADAPTPPPPSGTTGMLGTNESLPGQIVPGTGQ
jgi:hypothetical protein